MKKLLSTTSFVVALGFPVFAQDQMSIPEDGTDTQRQAEQGLDFLSHPGQPNLFLSELMGHDVYARRSHDDTTGTDAQPSADQSADHAETADTTDEQATGDLGGDAFSSVGSDGSTNMHLMGNADMDELQNIGQISEFVLTAEGQLLAIAIDIGEFFGTNPHEVILTPEQFTVSHNPDDLTQMHIVLNAGPEMLEQAPEFDRMAMRDISAAQELSDPVLRETATPDRGEN